MNGKIEQQPIENEREKESRFGLWIYKGEQEALEKIRQRYEEAEDPDDNLDHHNTDHAETIYKRVNQILTIIMRADPSLVTPRDIKIGCLTGVFHDIVNNNYADPEPDNGFNKTIRQYHGGDNEKASAKELREFMKKANQETGREVFTQEDMDVGTEAIEVTIPEFKNNTTIQPNLDKNSSPIARAVALSDIGAAGLNTAEFLKEGDNFFRELNKDITRVMRDNEKLTNEEKEYFKKRMIGWAEFQPQFAQGRKDLLDKELEGIPDTAKNAVRTLFSKFDESIQVAQGRAEKRKTMSFEELVEDMGYQRV